MAKLIFAIAVAGFLLLLIATIALVILNWSEKTLTPVVTILLVGTATILATVFVSLKESKIESAFSTSVVIDTLDGAPPVLGLDPENIKLASRLNDLVTLGHPAVTRDGKTELTIQKPANDAERFTFCGELLQYKILLLVETIQRGGWSVGQRFGNSFSTVNEPMVLTSTENYPLQRLTDIAKKNRFSNSDMEQFHWKYARLPLPKNANVDLIHLLPQSGPEQFVVRIQKPLFFNIDFVVVPLGATGMGVLPKGLSLPPEQAARCQTYQIRIAMNATFDQITAGNSQTQEYKDWAAWLFSKLQDKLAE